MLIEDEIISFWQPHERESMTRKKFYKIYKGVEQMPEERREGEKGEMLEKKEGEEVADVEPIHPTEARGGKKRSLLDTCK